MRKVIYIKMVTDVFKQVVEVEDNATITDISKAAKLMSDLHGWDEHLSRDLKEWTHDITDDDESIPHNPIYN